MIGGVVPRWRPYIAVEAAAAAERERDFMARVERIVLGAGIVGNPRSPYTLPSGGWRLR
jgi:hypothetical protein